MAPGSPAGPQPTADLGGARTTGALPAARPGCEVQPRLRRRVPRRRRRGAVDAGAGAECECLCGTLGAHGARRVPGLAASRRAQAPGAGAARLRPALPAPRGATTTGRGWKGPAAGLSQQAGGAEGSLTVETYGRVGAALTTPGRAGTARRAGSGKQDEKVYARNQR